MKSESLFIEVYCVLSMVLCALRHVKTDGSGSCQQERPKMWIIGMSVQSRGEITTHWWKREIHRHLQLTPLKTGSHNPQTFWWVLLAMCESLYVLFQFGLLAEIHTDRLVQYEFLCVWLFSLHTIYTTFVHAVTCTSCMIHFDCEKQKTVYTTDLSTLQLLNM